MLADLVQNGRVSHAYIFCGEKGVGKAIYPPTLIRATHMAILPIERGVNTLSFIQKTSRLYQYSHISIPPGGRSVN